MNGWQPISTAPKDGTPFLVVAAIYRAETGQLWRWDRAVVWCDDETGQFHSDCWPGYDLEDCHGWQPLPEPPAQERQEG